MGFWAFGGGNMVCMIYAVTLDRIFLSAREITKRSAVAESSGGRDWGSGRLVGATWLVHTHELLCKLRRGLCALSRELRDCWGLSTRCGLARP